MLDLDEISDLQAALIRADLELWCEHALLERRHKPAAHHRLLIRELEAIARGTNDRLMVFMPPGSAKSTYASVLFPPWFLAQGRNLAVIGASYTASLAESFSRKAQEQIREYGDVLGLNIVRQSVELWTTSNGGQYRSVGVGGSTTGFRSDVAIVDDPVRSRADADSETYRENAWDWYQSALLTRLKPRGRIVICMTRWHEDDLAGRLLTIEPNRWKVISLPALAGDADPLGRAPGAPLWGDDAYGYGAELIAKRASYEAAGGLREWNALYQQNPRPLEGLLFQVDRLRPQEVLPASAAAVRAWDLAATADGGGNPDWTVGVLMQRDPDGKFGVTDVTRMRGGPEQVEQCVVDTAARDGRGVAISLPQDPGQAGKAQVLYLTRKLAGFRVESSPETGDKATRASPLAAQVNVGNVTIRRADWNRAYVEELRGFPAGTKDDQVDASSRAFNFLTAAPAPARSVRINHLGR